MAIVRCPSNVSSITLATSGVLAPASGLITCTSLEATNLVQPTQKGAGTSGIEGTNLTTGATNLKLPSTISSITINGNVYAPDAANVISAVPAADADIFLRINRYKQSFFELVSG